jgi:Zn finger protein HypA/HybF involved in hydrogenase expression
MHEVAIAQNIIEEAKKHGEVEEIYLELGELSHAPSHELVEYLQRLVDWKIHSREIPAKVKCSCGFEGRPIILERSHDSFLIECPKCKAVPELINGKDIKIVKVVVK